MRIPKIQTKMNKKLLIRQKSEEGDLSFRPLSFRDGSIDEAERTVRLSVCSDSEVFMGFFSEILSHKKGAMVTGERQKNLPLLFNHDRDQIIGRVEKLEQEEHKTYATVRFAKNKKGDECFALLKDNVLTNVSVGYQVYEREWRSDDPEDKVLIATEWELFEVSLVSVPADASVGLNRSKQIGDDMTMRAQRWADKNKMQFRSAEAKEPQIETTEIKPAGTEAEQSRQSQTQTVDLRAVQVSVRNAERQRMNQIYSMSRTFNLSDKDRDELLNSDLTIDQVRAQILDKLATRQNKPAASSERGLQADAMDFDGQIKNYSVLRAINAMMTNNWDKAGFEREVSQELATKMRNAPKGLYVPTNLPMSRDGYNVGVPADGGNLVATNLLAGSFIELLRNKAVVSRLGATWLTGLVGNVSIPRQSGASNVGWVDENGQLPTTQAAFDNVTLKLKTVGAISSLSRNLLLQSSIAMESFVRNELATSIALGIDLAALCGSGSGAEPIGIANVPGIGSVVGGENGAKISFDHLIAMETAVATENADVGNMAYLCNASTIGALKTLKDDNGSYLWKNISDAKRNGASIELNGYPVVRSNQVRSGLTKGTSTNCSELFFGNWSDLLIGEWGVMDLMVNPYGDGFRNGSIEVRAMQSIDIAVRHPQSFCVFSDALLS